ncbi:hypothetical protein BDN72DRAFT_37717 [Pluteus cervinus]|uniref:Uncharacterized protein n=1 Tax=Pluteus cervinus TaxID=181527 RepID=A0ACD3BHI3_9AGAR|nr:hypothetical protein BDN72DRAFT_37717 [Pluteus cervinus]
MPKATSRPLFPSSTTDFALPSSPSNVASTSAHTLDDTNPLLPRFRRSSLLAPKAGYLLEARHSPLISSFTIHSPPSRRGSHSATHSEDFESDKERMSMDGTPPTSGSSGNPTPPLMTSDNSDEDLINRHKLVKPPSTPPRKPASTSEPDSSRRGYDFMRHLSGPLRQPRILHLLTESKPEENEVRSEAAFQRLVTSCSDLPLQPRTPRSVTDRGRYPEEAGQDDLLEREDSPSDDEDDADALDYAFSNPNGSELINIPKHYTPASSVNGDDLGMSIAGSPSLGATAMDVDIPSGSPLLPSVLSTPINHWRYTPPPTTSAVRSNKRKFDDRFDPYPTASKRRAVSPSLSHLRDNHVGSPIGRSNPRLPISIPITIPNSAVSSTTSSPTISGSYPSFSRPVSMTSSPTLRASMGLASPILRPVPRSGMSLRRNEGDEKEIEGAGEAVNGLTLC